MALFTDIDAQVAVLRELFGGDVGAEELSGRMSAFSAEELVDAMVAASALVRCAERIGIVGAGIAATRSTREAGQDGLAQARGHRSTAALVQEITGTSHSEAQRQVRLGQSILDNDAGTADADAGPGDRTGAAESDQQCEADAAGRRTLWHAPLSAALLQGRISPAQQDAIQRGLGHPADDIDDTHAAWSAAAEQLIADATERTVEELRIQAGAVRDQLDPEGGRAALRRALRAARVPNLDGRRRDRTRPDRLRRRRRRVDPYDP